MSIETLFEKYAVSEETMDFVARQHGCFINGQSVPALSGEHIDVYEPSTGAKLTTIAAAEEADVDLAVQSADKAQREGPWARMAPSEREAVLFRLADLIDRNSQILAELECLDMGKPIVEARDVDVAESASYCRYMAGWATKIDGRVPTLSAGEGQFAYTRKEPVGVVGAIIPWNFPFSMACWKVVAPLAAGCTVVLKPSEIASLTSLKLAELALEAGVSAGVFNVVTGDGIRAGAALVSHPLVRKVAFTGSTQVGKSIGKAAMDNLTRTTLELGGKSPMIVLEDADPAKIASGLADGIFFNAGQVCTAGSRLLVHKRCYDAVVEAIAGIADQYVLGSGLNPATSMGPMASKQHQQKVLSYIEVGLKEGARRANGRTDVPDFGYFVPPTVFADCRDDMQIVREEIFGPVLTVSPFKTADEAVERANQMEFGLAASVWSNDMKAVMDIVPRIEAGIVWVNTHNPVDASLPFGGMKQSGIGRENGPEQLEAYLETKSVWINHAG